MMRSGCGPSDFTEAALFSDASCQSLVWAINVTVPNVCTSVELESVNDSYYPFSPIASPAAEPVAAPVAEPITEPVAAPVKSNAPTKKSSCFERC
jgi:hypothetical protein